MEREPFPGEPERLALDVTDLVESLLAAAGTGGLERVLVQRIVAHGLATAVSLWRLDEGGGWSLRVASGPVELLPPATTVRAILTHGWLHELGDGSAIVQEGDVALALAGVPEPTDDLLDQIEGLLFLRRSLFEDGSNDVPGPLPA